MAWLHKARNPGLISPFRGPTGFVRVDPFHPLARGLTACWVPSMGFVDVTRQGNDGAPNGLKMGAGVMGPCYDGGGYLSVPYSAAAFPNGNSTIAAWVTNNAQSAGEIIGRWFSGGKWGFKITSTSDVVRLDIGVSGGETGGYNSFRTVAGITYGVVAVADFSAGSASIYNSGGYVNAMTGLTLDMSAQDFGIGAVKDGGSYGTAFDGKIHIAMAWNRALTAEEVWALDAAPFQFLIPAG